MTDELILISEMNGIRNGFKWGHEIWSESIERIFDKMEAWLRKERVPVQDNDVYRIEHFEPKRDPLPGEGEMPIYSVCHRCRKAIRFEKMTEEERQRSSEMFDSVARYDEWNIYHTLEMNGEKAWGCRYERGSDGDCDRIVLCRECGKFVDDFMRGG